MPNGHDQQWVRFCGAVDGFRSQHGHWPSRVRGFASAMQTLRSLFDEDSLARLESRLELVDGDGPFQAEDQEGNSYNYGAQGFPKQRPNPDASAWLGVSPKPHDDDDPHR